ncbi:MAG: DUF6173 family protein [Rhodobacter sp.]|nr:DUF6173 family protein [Rhodobacter sp.]
MTDHIKTTAEALEDQAMPRAHSVHTDPQIRPADETVALPRSAARKPVQQKSPAEWAYERLILYIKNFEDQLDNEHEVAMGFTGAQAGVIRIEGIGYFDPDIVTFYGSDPAGTKTQLIQHVTQLNVLLRALPKARADRAPQRIGFRLAADLEAE